MPTSQFEERCTSDISNVKKYITPDTFVYDTDSVKVTVYTKIYSDGPLDSISKELKAIIRHKIIENTITKQIVRKNAFFAGPSVGLGTKSSYIFSLHNLQGQFLGTLGVEFCKNEKKLTNFQLEFIQDKASAIGAILNAYLYTNVIKK